MPEPKEAGPNKTNNFYSFFELELLPEETREGLPESHIYFGSIWLAIQKLEQQGNLWSRLKNNHPELFQEILQKVKQRKEEFLPDFNTYIDLVRTEKFAEAEKFREEKQIMARSKASEAKLTPLLNQAFDLLVSWGASPETLRQ